MENESRCRRLSPAVDASLQDLHSWRLVRPMCFAAYMYMYMSAAHVAHRDVEEMPQSIAASQDEVSADEEAEGEGEGNTRTRPHTQPSLLI